MTATVDFRREQRGVAMAMAGALVTTVVVLGMAVLSDRATPLPFTERLHATIRADAFVVAWLAAAVANVARLRFFSARDIAGSSADGGSDTVRVAGAILQNTLEQVVLAIGTHLIVAAVFARSVVPIQAMVGLFAVGRLLFWVGYRHGARARAFGFALTFYPSLLALAASIAAIAFGGSG